MIARPPLASTRRLSACVMLAASALAFGPARAADTVTPPSPAAPSAPAGEAPAAAAPAAATPHLFIREFRVVGAHALKPEEVQDIVYPFLGPGRTPDDVEHAGAALQKAYQDRGYQAAAVQIPAQRARGGIVLLEVHEGTLGQLRVRGSRYFLPSSLKARARSLAEGKALNFNDVNREILALNQLPDRQIAPVLIPTAEPGTVDIDLNVKDKNPLHGSVELNNRYNADTTPLRLSVSANYNNLWQLGHTLGGNYSVAPEKRAESEIVSGYYIARFAGAEYFSFMLQGRKQSSNVTPMGTAGVTSPGQSIGGRGIFTLPGEPHFFQSATIGFDYNHYGQDVLLPGTTTTVLSSPLTYFPLSLSYSATWAGKGYSTDFNSAVTMAFRGFGSSLRSFDTSRFKATGSFIKLRGDISHTHDLPGKLEAYVKVEGQIADSPLVNYEQIGAGGIGSVRGYLESEVLADNGVIATLELRSPSLLGFMGKPDDDEWRIYIFTDAAYMTLRSPLVEQQDEFNLFSAGVGTRIKLYGHLNGSLDLGIPFTSETATKAHDPRLSFRAWVDF